MLDLKQVKLQDSGKEVEGKAFYSRHVLAMKDNLWERVFGLGSKTWKGCDRVELLVGQTYASGDQE